MTSTEKAFAFLDPNYGMNVSRPRYQTEPMDFSPVADADTVELDDAQGDDSALAQAFEKHNARIHANAYRYGHTAQ